MALPTSRFLPSQIFTRSSENKAVELMVPSTPAKRREQKRNKRRSYTPSPPTELLDLPEELMLAIFELLSGEDLAFLACASRATSSFEKRLDGRWKKIYEQTFNGGSEAKEARQLRAAALAGSWKALFIAKTIKDRQLHEAADNPEMAWEEPCSFEIQAAVESLLVAAPTSSAGLGTSVMFLLDGSGSVTEADFKTMTSFVSTALEAIVRTHPAGKAGIVQFSNDVKVEMQPQTIALKAFSAKLDAMTRINGGTNIALAIVKAGQLLKAADSELVEQHAKAGTQLPVEHRPCKVLVLLTDGRVDAFQAHEAMGMAERLADEQGPASLHGFGVGRGVDKAELLRIISACGGERAEERYTALRVLGEDSW